MYDGPDPAAPVRARWRFSDWQFDPVLNRPVAMLAERLSPSGPPVESWHVTEVRAMDQAEFDAVTAVPEAASVDALRGPVTFRSVFDFRDGARSVTALNPNGAVTSPMSASDLGMRPPPNLSVVGWVTAGALVATLVGIRIVRNRRRGVAASGGPTSHVH